MTHVDQLSFLSIYKYSFLIHFLKTFIGLQMGPVRLIIHFIICFRILPQISLNFLIYNLKNLFSFPVLESGLCWFDSSLETALGVERVTSAPGSCCIRDNKQFRSRQAPAVQSHWGQPWDRQSGRRCVCRASFSLSSINSMCAECLKWQPLWEEGGYSGGHENHGAPLLALST